MEFKDKTVLITGGATGIGRASGIALAREGCRVLLVDVDADGVERTAAELGASGASAHALVCDLALDDEVKRLGQKVIKDFGVPDIVHNNAYVGMSGTIDAIDISDWRRALEVNVLGYVRVVDAFVRGMIARGSGHFINTASPMGIVPDPIAGAFLCPYMASKAANISLSQSMALGLQAHGIGVSIFFPDVTQSDSARNVPGTAPPAFKQALQEIIGNGATPESSALALVAGLRNDQFMISAEPGFAERLVRGAANGLDPRLK